MIGRKVIVMSKKLKPCPFCGGEAAVSERYDEYCAVRCITCGAKTNFSMTKKGAIELWNRRKPIDKIVEQLEKKKSSLTVEYGTRYVAGLYDGYAKAIEIVKGGAV